METVWLSPISVPENYFIVILLIKCILFISVCNITSYVKRLTIITATSASKHNSTHIPQKKYKNEDKTKLSHQLGTGGTSSVP